MKDLHHVKSQLHLIQLNANKLFNLINEILTLSKLESGKLELNLEEHNLKEIVNEQLQYYADYSERQFIRVVRKLPPEKCDVEYR